MIHTHIYLTQTHISEVELCYKVAYFFDKYKTLDLTKVDISETSSENAKSVFESMINSQRAMTMDFASKSDYRETIVSLYKTYEAPTLVFLGNLSGYSAQLQEGMLRLLEEPPNNLFIVLLAHHRGEIISTIASRSQIHLLSNQLTLSMLDGALKETIKKKLPPPADCAKSLISNTFDYTQISDFSKLEREEIDFWLWQVGTYTSEFYKQNPHQAIGQALGKILKSQKLNNQNSLKKFVFANLSL